ncbi:MAG: hypothetical protein HGA76_12185 [Candidatus Firestonebacteria bacterium]|nr:hypothetical protein [Candidatus Firestonebacteria bacterium]
MGRKQKLKQARHEAKGGNGKPRREVTPGTRVRRTWLFAVLGVLLVLIATAVALFMRNQTKIFQMAMVAQAYQIDEQLKPRLGRFSSEEGQRLEAVLHEVQTLANLPGMDARAAGQLKFVLGVVEEISRAGELEPGEIEKLEAQTQAARDYLNRQDRSRRP